MEKSRGLSLYLQVDNRQIDTDNDLNKDTG